jgi:hypothetical protein
MISAKGERIPFLSPLRTKEAKGCVEKWMMQVLPTRLYVPRQNKLFVGCVTANFFSVSYIRQKYFFIFAIRLFLKNLSIHL